MKRVTVCGNFLIIALAMLFSTSAIAADSPLVGEWKGKLEIPGSPFDIIARFDIAEGTLNGSLDIIQQNAKGLKLVNISAKGTQVTFALDGVPGDPTFTGELSDDGTGITGTFTQGDASFPFSLDKVGEEAATKGLDEKLAQLTAFIDTSMVTWDIPGLAIAIVKDGETVFAKGFGLRDIENELPMTPNTLLGIGSTTKSMTCACLEMLVEEGLIEWDEPVKTYLPDFQLKDEYITQRLTVRDLVTHRSGLARHDFMWYGSPFSRKELYERMRHLDFAYGLREKYYYNNLMYMTAGILIEEVSGQTWEEFIRTRLHEPLGMDDVNYSVTDMPAAKEAARTYHSKEGEIIPIPYKHIDSIGPAGSVNASVNDMAKWLTFNLNQGKVGDKQLISTANIRDMQIVHFPTMNPNVISGDMVPLGYGLGWVISYYHDHYFIHHGGGIDGFSTAVSILPNDGIGIVVITNVESGFSTVVNYYANDLMLDYEPVNWTARLMRRPPSYAAGETAEKETQPSHELKDYAGKYEHPGYGAITITHDNDTLTYAYNGLSSAMVHEHYDTFGFADGSLKSIFEAIGSGLPTFRTGSSGDIESLVVKYEPTVDPIVFKKTPTVREYTVKRTREPILLDGRLDEKDWKNAEYTEEFVIHQNGARPTYPTKAQLLWDDRNLYIAFSVTDRDVWATMENHDEHLWTEEAVEMFIDPDGDGRKYLELQVNPLGTTLDLLMNREYAKGGTADFDWTCDNFTAAVSVNGKINEEKGNDKGWTCEIVIPFASVKSSAPKLSYPPENGDSWRMNLCRIENIRGKDKAQEAVSWNQTDSRGFHAPDKAGRIIYSTESVR